MTNLLIVAFVVLALSPSGSEWRVSGAVSDCHRLDPCRCEYKDGRGLDLNPVVDKSETYLEAMDPMTRDRFLFHPCGDIKYLPQPNEDKECGVGDGYALCRWDNANQTHKLGTVKDSSFHSDEFGQEYLVFNLNAVVTSVQLICVQGTDRSFLYVNNHLQKTAEAVNQTNLILFSPYACPITIEVISKPSTGSVLLILFLIGTFTYFTIGSIVRFMYLGARGIEVIPNLEFWKDLPGLVRDGIRFVQNGCRVERGPDPDSYDAI